MVQIMPGLIKMRLIRSKTRKREDSAVVSPIESPLPHRQQHNKHQTHNNQQYHQNLHQVHQNQNQNNNKNATIKSNGDAVPQMNMISNPSPWVFPPLPPQPNIYSVNQLALMQANQYHKHGFKGLKRQLSGRFKRMISRKPTEPPLPTIPAELKPQLRTIYVY